ncbi:hypothetical protein OIU77_014324 [Salix suchowensis]|uniref:Uncharacterized protein n=1 Tax=Salix suchowensis TaxID=1278906 RepID=A0ABQ8ZXQ6_9ROSI|nr:hypothetical protein OIU77_014324 [Salix suchowensis]
MGIECARTVPNFTLEVDERKNILTPVFNSMSPFLCSWLACPSESSSSSTLATVASLGYIDLVEKTCDVLMGSL